MARNIPAPAGGASPNSTVTSGEIGRGNSIQQGTQTTVNTGVSTTTGSQSSRETSNVDFLDPVARKALNDLIKSLSEGGTPEQRQFLEQRLNEIVSNQDIRGQYSQANAFAQSQGAANSAMAKSLQATLPQIAASVDAAGTSGGAFSGLLTQQAAADAAAMAAELGLQTSVQYGQIQAGLSGVLEQLTRADSDPIVSSLLQALNIAKGSSEVGVRTSSGRSSSTTMGTETSVVNTNNQANENKLSLGQTTTQQNRPAAQKPATTFSGLATPSSNRAALDPKASFTKGKTSYSQFG